MSKVSKVGWGQKVDRLSRLACCVGVRCTVRLPPAIFVRANPTSNVAYMVLKLIRINFSGPVSGGLPLFLDGRIRLCDRADVDPERRFQGYLSQLSFFGRGLMFDEVGLLYQTVAENSAAGEPLGASSLALSLRIIGAVVR